MKNGNSKKAKKQVENTKAPIVAVPAKKKKNGKVCYYFCKYKFDIIFINYKLNILRLMQEKDHC